MIRYNGVTYNEYDDDQMRDLAKAMNAEISIHGNGVKITFEDPGTLYDMSFTGRTISEAMRRAIAGGVCN